MDLLQPPPPRVSSIILNWNGREDTLECLESLRNVNYPALQVILVDNASTDGLNNIVQKQFPEVILLRNEENVGFAEGNNVGIRYALSHNTDYVLLLNNDTTVESSFLSTLIEVGEKYPEIGMLSPLIFWHTPPDNIWFYGGSINWQNGCCSHKKLPEDRTLEMLLQKTSQEYRDDTDYLSGCALLVKTKVIQEIGLLDARFFAYYEDTDWCVRCRKAGWKLAVVPAAKIWHKSSSGGNSDYGIFLSYRNTILFLWKHSQFPQFLLRVKRHLYRTLAEYSWDQKRYDTSSSVTPLDGVWAGLYRKFGKNAQKMPIWLQACITKNIRYLLWIFRYPG